MEGLGLFGLAGHSTRLVEGVATSHARLLKSNHSRWMLSRGKNMWVAATSRGPAIPPQLAQPLCQSNVVS